MRSASGEKGRRLARSTAICAVALCVGLTDAAAAKKRRVEELLEDPKDYSSFEKRRLENIDRLSLGEASYFTLFDGRVTAADEPAASASQYIDDPVAADKIKTIVEDLLPEAMTLRPPYAITFLDSPTFSPFATEAGAIIIPLGFLRQTRSQDVLGFVVGHEVSHLLNDDFKLNERKEAINAAAGVAVLAASLASGGGEVSGGSLKAVRAAQALVALNELVLGPSWGRKQESRADELGFDLSMDAGMSPDGAFDLLMAKVENYKKKQAELDDYCGKKQSVGSLLLKGVIEQSIGAPGLLSEGANPADPICQQRNSVVARLLAKHPSDEKRLEGLTEYRGAFYAEIEGIRSQTFYEVDALTALSPNGPLSRLSNARDARIALDAGDIASAEILAKKSLSGPDDASPGPRYINYLVQKRKGNRKAAIAHLEKVVDDPNTTATLEIYLALADEYAADGDYGKALAKIDHGANFHGRGPFLPQRVRFLTALGDVAGAQAAFSECLAQKDVLLEARCRAAIIPPEPVAPEIKTGASSGEGATIFARLVRERGGAALLARLEGEASVTIFAPSDGVMRRRLGATGIERLLAPENAAILEAFIAAHVIEGDIAASGVGADVVTAISQDAIGRPAAIVVAPEFSAPHINGAGVIAGDIAASNGRIHVIDALLASPEDGAPAASQ